jgi:hypothetical protein
LSNTNTYVEVDAGTRDVRISDREGEILGRVDAVYLLQGEFNEDRTKGFPRLLDATRVWLETRGIYIGDWRSTGVGNLFVADVVKRDATVAKAG